MRAEPWRRYFVVFADSIVPHWWNRFLRPGYQHCYVLIWDGACWLYVDPMMDRTRVHILDLYEPEHPAAWVEDESARVLEAIPDERDGMRVPWSLGAISCVESCKALLGIRAPCVLTPWQLAQYLRRRRRKHEGQEAEANARRARLDGRANPRARPTGGPDHGAQAPDHGCATLWPREPAERR